mgnify:CR=1 FL=1
MSQCDLTVEKTQYACWWREKRSLFVWLLLPPLHLPTRRAVRAFPTSPQLKYACYPPVESTSSQFTNPPSSCLVPRLPIHNSTLPPMLPVYNLSFTPQPSIMPYQCSTSPYYASPPLPPMFDTPASPVRYPPYSPPPLERGLHAPAIMFPTSYPHSDTSSTQ